MFDIGFSEVLLIFVIALVVLGPEKLPRLASQVGRWIGRARAMARQFREQLEEEVNLEEVRKTREQKPKTTTTADAVQGEPSSGAGQASTDPHDAQPQQASETHASGTTYTGPDPADFRADTFSHAHATNEYGANPYTSNGAAEEPTPHAGGSSASTEAPPAGSSADEHGGVASEANVAAAQPQAETGSEQHSPQDEGYAPRRPRDNTPGTDNHGN